jgi:RNA polymerase sigma-70 factor (ECF subfamily)
MANKRDEERELVERLRAGEEKAVTAWFRQYQARLMNYVARRISEAEDVNEVTQEIFINCLRNIANFRGGSSLFTWMCAIAKHEIADFYRKRYAKKFIRALPLGEMMMRELETGGDQQQRREQEAVLKETLERVFGKIAGHYRELLMLKYVDRKKVAEIARETGRTIKAVESDLWRARRDFKVAYEEVA